MKNEMPSLLLLDEKLCFIMLPLDTLQNLRQVITALEMATLKIYKVAPPIGENILHCKGASKYTKKFQGRLCVSCANFFLYFKRNKGREKNLEA
jgi:hypothetical protein